MFNAPQREVLKITPEEARLLKRLQNYREDFPRHARECLRIVDKEARLNPLVLNKPQMIIHAKVEAQKAEHGMVRAIILKGRKQGCCLSPDTRVMMSDLTWRRIDRVDPGEKVLSYDENPVGVTKSGRDATRKMRVGVVEAVATMRKELFEVVLSNGTVLKTTGDHRWLTRQRGGTYVQWRHVRDMKEGDYLRAATCAPDEEPLSYEDGWVGGLLDGDGSCAVTAASRVQLSQVDGTVLRRYRTYLEKHGLHYYESIDTRTALGTRYRKLKDTPIHNVRVDRFTDLVKLLGRTKPCKFDVESTYVGKKLPKSCDGFEAYPRVVSIQSLGVRKVVDLQTSEKTFVAEGIVSHNSTYIGGRFYSKTRLWKHRHAKVMAHVQTSTDALFDMVKNIYDNDPLRLRADTQSAKQYKFSNSSSYTVATAGGSGEAGRGDTPTLAHLSEVAFYKNAEKNFAGFANSVPIAPGTEVFVESTGNGVGNDFHQRWSRAEAGMEDHTSLGVTYIPIFIPWFISDEYRLPVPSGFELRSEPEGDGLPSEKDIAEIYGLSLEQMVWRRFQVEQALGSVEVFMQEYPNTPSEAFQTPGMEPFIKPIYISRARRRKGITAHGARILGVDPAGLGGDKFAVTFREGHVVHWHRGRTGLEPGEEQANWVASLMEQNGIDRVNIDYSGGWGSALLSAMRMLYPKLAEKCHPVDFGAKSQAKTVNPHKPGPRNRRAEMYMRARDWLMLSEGVSIPDEDELQSDMSAISAKVSGQSTDTTLESKIDVKRRLKRSPDTSDSFVLTFAVPDRVVQTSLTPARRSGTEKFDEGSVERPIEEARPINDGFGTGRTGYDSGGSWMN